MANPDAPATARFRVTTLGSFEIHTVDGIDVLDSRSARHLALKFLVAQPGLCAPSADVAAALDWDASRPGEALRLQLRVELAALRKRFAQFGASDALTTVRRDGEWFVVLDPACFERDYVALERAAQAALASDDGRELFAVLEAWTGIFFPGDDQLWVRDVRARIERTIQRVAVRALQHPAFDERERNDVAVHSVRFLRDIDAAQNVEPFARDVIEALAACGERVMAREIADHFAARVSPDAREEIDALFDAPAGNVDTAGVWAAIAPAGAPDYVGRTELFATLRETITARDRLNRGWTVVVAGPHGSGRTRTALELLDTARRVRGAVPIVIRGDAGDGLTLLAEAFTAVVERAGSAFRVHDGMLATESGARDPERAPHVYARLLYALAVRRPVAIAIDDLDRADLTLERFARLAERRAREAPIFFFCTALLPLSPPITAFVAERDEIALSTLAALPPAEALQLATAVVAGRPGAPAAAEIAARSGGNPRYIVEAVAHRGELSPAFARRLVERLSACDARERATFQALCRAGGNVSPERLAPLLAISEMQLFDRLEALLALRFVHETADGQFVADPLLAAVAERVESSRW